VVHFSRPILVHFEKAIDIFLKIIDVLGREVGNLVNEYQNAGEYGVQFDGHILSGGIYFIKLQARIHPSDFGEQANDFVDVKKCVLIK
jgi:hypothetical protein